MQSRIKDPSLAEQGWKNIELAEGQMLALAAVRERFAAERPFEIAGGGGEGDSGEGAGAPEPMRIALALHITKETAVLVRTLRAGGAEVAIAGCNPLSTQDDVAAALAEEPGVYVFGHKGESPEEYYEFLEAVIGFEPHLTIDDGCDLVTAMAKNHPDKAARVIGGCEETTTGVVRLKAMELDGAMPFPVVAVNDNLTKHLMDNYYGTGQSTLDGILRATNVMFAGKTAVVAGYGSCGKGVAMRLKGLGANVIVTEIDQFKALQAHMDGLRVMKMIDAAPLGDIFITVTGNVDVITAQHAVLMKNGAILANSGHFDCEIDVSGIEAAGSEVRLMRPFMKEIVMGGTGSTDSATAGTHTGGAHADNARGKKIYILADGRLVNLAAAEGHPSEVMSLSFCGQALACEWLVQNQGKLDKRVYTLPPHIDANISHLHLSSLGISIDELTEKQKKYIASWEEGT